MEVDLLPRPEAHRAETGLPGWQAPPLRLVIFGEGSAALAAALLGRAHGAEVAVASSNRILVDAASSHGIEAMRLDAESGPLPAVDAGTAALVFAPGHARSGALLERLREGPAFFVGVMEGPGGAARSLVESARHAGAVAMSALAQVSAEYRKLAG